MGRDLHQRTVVVNAGFVAVTLPLYSCAVCVSTSTRVAVCAAVVVTSALRVVVDHSVL